MSAPLVRVVEADVPAVATAASDDIALTQAPFDGTITAVEYVPEAAVTGAATNNRTISLVNKGQSGVGATTVATLLYDSGINSSAYNETALTLSSTAANRAVAQGDTLQWRSIANGTGLADPGGLVKVTISRS